MKTIGERLKSVREKDYNLNREQFAKLFEVTAAIIGEIEKNKKEPVIAILKNLTEQKNINLTWLLLGEGKKYLDDQENNKWKNFLLQSGLPLENDIKQFLEAKGAIVSNEYSYYRHDENRIIKEFSYDIDACFPIGYRGYINLLIECKYRQDKTSWIFLPEKYGDYKMIFENSFMHPNDYFKKNFVHGLAHYENFPVILAPLCSKGIEIHKTGQNPTSIPHAMSQLSYAFIEQVINGIESQIDCKTFYDTCYYNIPIIVTTADLYRLNENINIDDIKNAVNLTELASSHDILIVEKNINVDLRNHNLSRLNSLIERYGEKKLQEHRNDHYVNPVSLLFHQISRTCCPKVIVIIKHTKENRGFEQFLQYIDDIQKPAKYILDKIEEQNEMIKNLVNKMSS